MSSGPRRICAVLSECNSPLQHFSCFTGCWSCCVRKRSLRVLKQSSRPASLRRLSNAHVYLTPRSPRLLESVWILCFRASPIGTSYRLPELWAVLSHMESQFHVWHLCCFFKQMDDIDAMFSDLLGEIDLLTQVSRGQLNEAAATASCWLPVWLIIPHNHSITLTINVC